MPLPIRRLRVAHLIPYLGGAQGGPVFNLACSAGGQLDTGCEVSIFTAAREGDGAPVAVDKRADLVIDDSPRWGAFRRCPALWDRVDSSTCDILHSHGLWTDVNRLAAEVARQRKIPHVLTPCGMLARGALRHHGWKKLPARIWFQDRGLREVACFQAQSEIEVRQIRDFGLRNPVALIPAAVAGQPQDRAVSAQEFRSLFRVPQLSRVLLYLGRLHPVKGVSRLVEAWATLQNEKSRNSESRELKSEDGPVKWEARRNTEAFPQAKARWNSEPIPQATEDFTGQEGRRTENWVLVLAGPDEGGYKRELESLVADLGCQQTIAFTGELNDQQKWGALDAAELFVMPSDFENFGVAIVEAMLAGLPVITTTGTPWQELPAAGAGWWIEPTAEALVSTLREALQMPEEPRRAMGLHAAEFAKRFRPERAAADLIQVYEWLLGRGPKPGCVV